MEQVREEIQAWRGERAGEGKRKGGTVEATASVRMVGSSTVTGERAMGDLEGDGAHSCPCFSYMRQFGDAARRRDSLASACPFGEGSESRG